jgi:hypothetical protein
MFTCARLMASRCGFATPTCGGPPIRSAVNCWFFYNNLHQKPLLRVKPLLILESLQNFFCGASSPTRSALPDSPTP